MMTETVRCPMCGKPNPADREVCQYCQARLKPLRRPPSEEDAWGNATSPGGSSSPDPGDEALPWGEDAAQEEDLASWLRDLAGEEAPEMAEDTEGVGAEDVDGEALLGRLNAVASETMDGLSTEAAENLAASTEQDEEGLGWLGETEPPLSSLEAEESFVETSPPPAEETDAELADWLSRLDSDPSSAEEEPPPAEKDEEPPDWLGEWAQGNAETEETSAPLEKPDVEEPLPDWLKDAAEPEEASPTESSSLAEDLPPWLTAAEAPDQGPTEEGVAPLTHADASAAADEDLAWLAALDEGEGETDTSEEPAAWLEDLEEGEPEGGALPAVSPFALATTSEAEGTPESSAEDAISEAESSLGLPAVPEGGELALDKLPEWLENLRPEDLELPEEETPGAGPQGDEAAALMPGQLPDWLEAIRPEETALEVPQGMVSVGAEEEEQEETRGPLAGLRGVLPAETLPKPHKPGSAASRLSLTEEQEQQAALLQETVEQEQRIVPPRMVPPWLPQRLLRVGIALVLLLSAWLPLVIPGLVPPLPDRFPPELVAANQVVNQLPDHPAVLVAVDYSPAWKAEMEATAAPLVDHLMVRGARLALISTQPTGPALAEHLIHQTLAEHAYAEGQQYVNLGYLSGGTAALQRLALDPPGAAPWSIQGYAAWRAAPLQGLARLADFDLVVVIADDPDVARAWIEQVQPLLEGTPLIMAVSAQAEPLVRPYYESVPPQIQGMVTGLLGALAYTRLTGRLGPGVTYWGGFSLGIWAAILLMLLGGLYNLILGLRTRRQAHG